MAGDTEPDLKQFYEIAESDEQDRCVRLRLFEQAMDANRRRMQDADDRAWEEHLHRADNATKQ